MEYKLIAIDMDGTLLNSKKEISDRTYDAIQKAKEKGIHIVLATGRLLRSAQFVAENLKLSNHILACNGAIIIDDKKVIYSRPMDLYGVEKVMSLGKKFNAYYHFYDESCLYSNTYVEKIVDYYQGRDQKIGIKIFKNDMEILNNKNLNIYKFLFIDNDLQKLESIKEELTQVSKISVSKSWVNNLEVMDTEASKGLGLKFLCNELNISPEHVIAIGDNENDISMINFAGLGVSMGNGEDIVKKQSNYITSSNDDDGVAKVIEKFILCR